MHTNGCFSVFFLLLLSVCLVFAADNNAPVEKQAGSDESMQMVSSESAELPSLTASDVSASQAAEIFSPVIARRFYQTGYELANSERVTAREAEQAIVFLSAALNLDKSPELSSLAIPLLIKLTCRYAQTDHSKMVSHLLAVYVSARPAEVDREVVSEAVRYLLDRLNSLEQRQGLLEELLRDVGNKNVVIGSELATQLGLMMMEKPDLKGAGFYLLQACNNNRYSRAAFAKLVQIASAELTPAMYLEHLRYSLQENPADIRVAVAFAEFAERLELYEVAAGAYEYCANLFAYLYPSEMFPSDIYLPWAMSCYNSPLGRQRCLQIAGAVRQGGRFDVLLEAIAGKAAAKIGDTAEADRIFQDAEDKIQQLFVNGPESIKKPSRDVGPGDSQKVGAKEIAWFYCFALWDPAKALDWANKAYAIEPNSPVTAAILAYSLVLNDQTEWAKPLLNNYQRNQIADLALARIQLKEGQKDLAVKTLVSSIAKDPGSLAAEQAKEILAQQGAAYAPPVDPCVALRGLEKRFGRTFVPTFVAPDKLISVQFNARSNQFSYGSDFDVTAAIVNTSSEPLVISDDGLFRGNIRIDADVTGDLNLSIPNLVSTKIRTTFFIEPGRSFLVPVQLITGRLGRLLFAHPQASLNIVFTLYLDPVVTGDGKVVNSIVSMAPAKLSVRRPGVELSGRYLRTQFNSISTARANQKIKTAQLFVGLLTEQQILMSGRRPPYKLMYADWMPGMLKSALTHESGLLRNRADSEWEVKVNTMADMLYLSLDSDLAGAVAENLNSPNWPVRLQAIYLLAKSPESKSQKVLDWSAKYDPDVLVRNMAVALGGRQ